MNKLWLIIITGLLVRMIPALNGVITADVKYHWVYVMQFLNSPSSVLHLYGAVKNLYHNTPVWLFVESITLITAAKLSISFAILIKVWPILADTGIMALLYRSGGTRLAWFYALSPVSILITGFHGQFDPVVMFFLLWSILLILQKDSPYSIFAGSFVLGIAIALKGFPVLLLPFFYLFARDKRLHWHCLVLALLPTVAVSLPFAITDSRNFFEALLLYSGSSDFGVGGIARLALWAQQGFAGMAPFGNIPDKYFAISKIVFFIYYALLVRRFNKNPGNIPYFALAVYAGFLAIYPGISAQYFLWLIPILLLTDTRGLWPYSLTVSAALCCFYTTYFPRVLAGNLNLTKLPMWLPHYSAIGYLVLNVVQWALLLKILFDTLKPQFDLKPSI